jgi:hypothetical protein
VTNPARQSQLRLAIEHQWLHRRRRSLEQLDPVAECVVEVAEYFLFDVDHGI